MCNCRHVADRVGRADGQKRLARTSVEEEGQQQVDSLGGVCGAAVAPGSARRRLTLCRVRMVAAAAALQLSFTSSMARIVISHICCRWGCTCANLRPCAAHHKPRSAQVIAWSGRTPAASLVLASSCHKSKQHKAGCTCPASKICTSCKHNAS